MDIWASADGTAQNVSATSECPADVKTRVNECLGDGWVVKECRANVTVDSVTGTQVIVEKDGQQRCLILDANGVCIACGSATEPSDAAGTEAAQILGVAKRSEIRWYRLTEVETQRVRGYVAFALKPEGLFSVNVKVEASGALVVQKPAYRVVRARVFLPEVRPK